MDPTDLAWLAGLLEGEGSFLAPSPSSPRRVSIALQMTDADVVSRAASLMGVGSYHVRRSENPAWKPTFVARLTGQRATTLMIVLRPLMGQRRQGQIDRALAALVAYPPPTRRFTSTQRDEIRHRFKSGESAVALADAYEIRRESVYRIARTTG